MPQNDKRINRDNSTERIGDVFTPLKWGKFVIKRFSLLPQWLNGETVFDPTMGTGQLLESLIVSGLDAGHKIEDLPVKNLFGCELNAEYRNRAVKSFQDKFNIDMSQNFIRADFLLKDLLFGGKKFDILLGNPPWINFSDLPVYYKELIKPLFLQYDLAENSGKLLLGGSRIELAALVVQKAIIENLNSKGRAFFFLPLSLFLNDGVHGRFRRFRKGDQIFGLKTLLDFNDKEIFPGVATRYGLAEFRKDEESLYPLPCERMEYGNWQSYLATPLGVSARDSDVQKGDGVVFREDKNIPPLSILSPGSCLLKGLPNILVEKRSFPRQGINTCGANDLFFFDSYKVLSSQNLKSCSKKEEECCIVSNKKISATLPVRFLSPLITKECFKEGVFHQQSLQQKSLPKKWVLLPYRDDGKVLSSQEMENEPLLLEYLTKHKDCLTSRKGVMINAHIKRGLWWALLGVGSYSFAPIKIVWEAYGRKEFRPQIFTSPVSQNTPAKQLWQANQALQAFIPCWEKGEAARILKELNKPEVEEYLLSLKMPGTMNWAQPGKIKRLLEGKV